ncbi:hypothetical protein FQA39_LY19207 [Lamprigera yunnana]|nr:hypothetical protein FQA39_LY19207 [Lamprigera yunnana]
MHTMLKPGGNVLLNFMANRVFMDIYKRMAEMTEWKIHFQKLKEIEPPTEYCDNSKIYYEGLLREIGFEPHLCFETKKIYVYSEKLFANTVIAVSFFDIPKDLEDKFVLDHKECMNNFNLVHTDENNNMYFHTTYTLLTIYASKSK